MTPLLQVEDLTVTFRQRRGILRRGSYTKAVDGIGFEVGAGETLGVVGESGSGKSTAARAILRLLEPERGSVRFEGVDILRLSARELRATRPHMQMVFQDPYSSLDPSMMVGNSVAEPLSVHRRMSRAARDRRVEELLELVGMSAHHLERYPYEFSGGQRQRIAIARAIALNPKLLVCDEAVSALDVSTQHQVTEVLRRLQQEFSISYIFIAHDLAVVRHIAHRVVVMYLGRIVEEGPTDRLFDHPGHPYTQALLSAVPLPNPALQRTRERIILSGDIPDPANPPSGCAFHTRCIYASAVCAEVRPEPTPVEGGGWAACHLLTDVTARRMPSAQARQE